MKVMKCPQCGANIEFDSKFCKYCGATMPDTTQRIEVKIEDAAEIKRAGYEEQESLLRQEQMKRQMKKEKMKPWIVVLKIASVIVPFGVGLLIGNTWTLVLMLISVLFASCWIIKFIS